ncbi:MAG: DUF485 domain-containing protein, partial [Phycisphaerales bacterium]|nr:DUF485 domain-containing protein [Phycisphaerales bacterium]
PHPAAADVTRLAPRLLAVRVNDQRFLYYLPLGRSKVLGHECLCHACRTQWTINFNAPAKPRKSRRKSTASELLESCTPSEIDALTGGMQFLQQIRDGGFDERTRTDVLFESAKALEYHHANRQQVGFLVAAFALAAVVLTFVTPICWFDYLEPNSRMSVAWPIGFTIAFVASIVLTAWSIRRARARTRDKAVRRLAQSLAMMNPTDHDLASLTARCRVAGFKHCSPTSPEALRLEVQQVLTSDTGNRATGHLRRW